MLVEMTATTESPLLCWRIGLGCGHVLEVQQQANLHVAEMLRLVSSQCLTNRRVRQPYPSWSVPGSGSSLLTTSRRSGAPR